jgi:hypothetical protein
MSIEVLFNGVSYNVPETGDTNWGDTLTTYLVSIAFGTLQPTTTEFTLVSGDVDFGDNYGLISKYFKSTSSNLSDSGILRLAVSDTIAWRNTTNDDNNVLSIDGSDNLLYNGNIVITEGTEDIVWGEIGGTLSNQTDLQSALDAKKTIATGNAYKFETTGATGLLQETTVTESRAVVTDANGLPSAATTTATEIGYVNGVTSAIQTQLNAKASTALNNLSNVAVNDYILPAIDNDVALGSISKEWQNVWTYKLTHNDLSETNPNLTISVDEGRLDLLSFSLSDQSEIRFGVNAGNFSINGITGLFNIQNIQLIGTTASTVPYLNADKIITSSSVTPTELGYLSGVSSAIQTQLNAKASTALSNLASVAINTSLVSDTDNTDDLGTTSINWRSLYLSTSIKNGSTTLATTTELGYLTGVTSAIQTQLDGKEPTLTKGDLTAGSSKISIGGSPTNSIIGTGVSVDLGTVSLDDLDDVIITDPVLDQYIRYNGSEWVNAEGSQVSAGAGVIFFPNDGPVADGNDGLSNDADVAETDDTASVTSGTSPVLIKGFITTDLNRTILNSGIWQFNSWRFVNNTSGVNILKFQVLQRFEGTGTVEITGSGTSRTATVTGGTPFEAGDANADRSLAGKVETPDGTFSITAFTSDSEVTIETPGGYVNESGVAYFVHRQLFTVDGNTIGSTSVSLGSVQTSQPAFAIGATDELSVQVYGNTTGGGTKTFHFVFGGETHSSFISTPFAIKHNNLAGLQGGTAGEFYHLSNAQYDIATQAATTSLDGYLTSTDWNTFNDKLDIVTAADIDSEAATAGYVLTADGDGNATWEATAAGGATVELDNLSDVAINTSLLPGTDDSIDLGSATFQWKDLFLGGDATLSAFGTAGVVHNDSSGLLSSSLIVNDDVDATAAIEYSKLDLDNSILASDIDSEASTDGYVLTSDGAGNAAWEAGGGGMSVPVGTIIQSPSAPTGDGTWLACDGSSASQSTYSALYSAISHKYLRYNETLGSNISTVVLGTAWTGSFWLVLKSNNNQPLKSTNGTSWSNTTNTLSTTYDGGGGATGRFAVGNTNNATVLVYSTSSTTIDRSTDGGDTWGTKTIAASGDWIFGNTSSTWVGVKASSRNVLYSTDDGSTWTQATNALTEVPNLITQIYWSTVNSKWVVSAQGPDGVYDYKYYTTTTANGSAGWAATAYNALTNAGAIAVNGKLISPSASSEGLLTITEDDFVTTRTQSLAQLSGNTFANFGGLFYNGIQYIYMTNNNTSPQMLIASYDTKEWYDIPIDAGGFVGGRLQSFSNSNGLRITPHPADPATYKFVLISNNGSGPSILFSPMVNIATNFNLPWKPGSYIKAL